MHFRVVDNIGFHILPRASGRESNAYFFSNDVTAPLMAMATHCLTHHKSGFQGAWPP